ncbi:CCA tRNA nucleotidyltransferase [Halobacteriales archaeon QS_8_69_26]|nr:MAG: CCA tRNA nucleotidyltransferase [Halobacteriales archaeon QS_8_69_26]
MSDRFAAVTAAVRERIDPGPDEREALRAAVDEVVSRARDAVADLPVEADVLQVGSTARDTWISGDRDLDVFVRFPPDLDREELEEYGLQVGHSVLPEGHEEYADHPYVKGSVDGFDVDLVPCYRLDEAADIRSAVDRTPFHTRWLAESMDAVLSSEARLCKAFMKGVGVYGSDLRTRGFSGYLTELLVVEFGGFRPLVEAAADWHPPVRLDPGDTGSDASFEDPLVVIDPTDPDRNVAAVLSPANLARFQHHARRLLDDPSEALFEPSDPDPLDPASVREHVRRRGTTPLALRFPAPDVVEDQLYPQLRRTLSNLAGELDRRGFSVLRTDAFARESAVLLLELSVAELPAVERHEGPPVHVRDHATGFYEKYDDDADGPFVEGNRYVVEREREVTRAAEFAESDLLFDVGIGPDVERALRSDRAVLVGDEVADLADEFGVELAAYFDPGP